jgi:MFS transporter, FHS family, glucose/mannose:H+ symporter
MITVSPRQASLVDAVAYAAIFVFGIVMALLGAIMPVLSGHLALALGDVGTLFLATNASMLIASIVVGPVMDRFGMKAPLAIGAVLVALALAAIASASGLGTLLPAVALLGLGGGALNAGANTLIADLHDEPEGKASALNLLGVFFGFGALLMPFSIGALLSTVGLSGLLWMAAVLSAGTGTVAAAMRFPAPKQAHGLAMAEIRRFAGMPLVLAFAFLLFFQSGNEFLLGGYFSTFLTREMAVPVARASYLLAAFWATIMVARVLLSRTLGHFGASRAVLGSAVVASAGTIAVSVASSTPLAIAGMLITGAALAGIFPTVLGMAGAAFRDHSGTVFGILFTVALTGGMLMPWIAGHLAEASGLRAVFMLAAANFAAVAVLNRMARTWS